MSKAQKQAEEITGTKRKKILREVIEFKALMGSNKKEVTEIRKLKE